MPPKRPRSHVNADTSIIKITEPFLSVGWSVEELDKDYGEDLFVRLFEHEEATPYAFFIQAKSSRKVAELKTDDAKYIRFPIDLTHLDYWMNFWEPVILVVWDSVSCKAHWEIVQSPEKTIRTSGRNAEIYIPIDNTLDADGLTRIATRTKSRHERFEQERHGAQVLINMLESMLGVKIDYNPQYGLLIVTGPPGEMRVIPFGKYLERVEELERKTGTSREDIINQSIIKYHETAEMLRKPGTKLVVKDSAGNTVKEYANIDELDRDAQRYYELKEE